MRNKICLDAEKELEKKYVVTITVKNMKRAILRNKIAFWLIAIARKIVAGDMIVTTSMKGDKFCFS